MADDELDAMLRDLGEIEIGKVELPKRWNEPTPAASFEGKRHDERDVKQLLSSLDKPKEMLKVRAPELPPVEISSAGVCGVCRKQVTDEHYQKTGDGRVYHRACFTCSVCRRAIEGGVCDKKEDGGLVCTRCIKQERCRRCAGAIGPTDKFVSPEDGVQFHTTCTTCGKCRNKLDLDHAFWLRGDLYCKSCAQSI